MSMSRVVGLARERNGAHLALNVAIGSCVPPSLKCSTISESSISVKERFTVLGAVAATQDL